MNFVPLSPASKERIDTSIEKFVLKYSHGCQMFTEQKAKGLGTAEDFNVLGWMYYEGIYESEEEILEATAYILGRALIRYAGFEWYEIRMNSNTIIGVIDKEHKYFIPTIEFILPKMYSLGGAGDYDINNLFFDAIFLLEEDARDEVVHPLFSLYYFEEYQKEIGLSVPSEVKPLIEAFWNHDSELLIRMLDIEFYEEYYAEDWDKIESRFKMIDTQFAKKYHKDNQWKPLYESTERMIELIDMDD